MTWGVQPGTLRFREVCAGLEKLSKTVTELEADGSRLIHPKLRTPTEKALAQKSKGWLSESEYPASHKSAKLTHDAIAMLDKVIKRFVGKKKRVPRPGRCWSAPAVHLTKSRRFRRIIGL